MPSDHGSNGAITKRERSKQQGGQTRTLNANHGQGVAGTGPGPPQKPQRPGPPTGWAGPGPARRFGQAEIAAPPGRGRGRAGPGRRQWGKEDRLRARVVWGLRPAALVLFWLIVLDGAGEVGGRSADGNDERMEPSSFLRGGVGE